MMDSGPVEQTAVSRCTYALSHLVRCGRCRLTGNEISASVLTRDVIYVAQRGMDAERRLLPAAAAAAAARNML